MNDEFKIPEPHSKTTKLLHEFKKGEKAAANELFARYFERVMRAARWRINQRKLKGTGSEDIAASVFESIWKKVDNGNVNKDELISSEDFWKLLCTLVRNKTEDHIRREQAQKRGGGKVHGESVFLNNAVDFTQGISQQAVEEITPFVVATFKDEHENFMLALRDEVLQEVVTLRLEGQKVGEIADYFGRSERWVKRKLALIREIWLNHQTNR